MTKDITHSSNNFLSNIVIVIMQNEHFNPNRWLHNIMVLHNHIISNHNNNQYFPNSKEINQILQNKKYLVK